MSIINFRLHKSTIYIFYKIKAEKAPHRGPGRRPAPGDSTHAARAPPPRRKHRPRRPQRKKPPMKPPHPTPTSGHTEDQKGPQHECLHAASPPSPNINVKQRVLRSYSNFLFSCARVDNAFLLQVSTVNSFEL